MKCPFCKTGNLEACFLADGRPTGSYQCYGCYGVVRPVVQTVTAANKCPLCVFGVLEPVDFPPGGWSRCNHCQRAVKVELHDISPSGGQPAETNPPPANAAGVKPVTPAVNR